MSEISALPSGIVEWLKSSEELSYINFLTEFPPIKKAVPLKKTTAAVGIKSMEIVDAFVENDEGVLERDEYCRNAEIVLRLSIHAPLSSGGIACHEAFADIIDCLTFNSGLNIISSGCDDIVSDRDTDAFVLRAWIKVQANLCPAATSSLSLPSFLDKDLLCGSHIRNEAIHVSPEQLEFLTEPVITGTYIGTGTTNRSFELGYKPKFMTVMRTGMPLVECNPSGGYTLIMSASSCETGSSLGLNLTERGFRVMNTDEYIELGYRVRLNDAGKTYVYFIVK